jgi:hypothetical protein
MKIINKELSRTLHRGGVLYSSDITSRRFLRSPFFFSASIALSLNSRPLTTENTLFRYKDKIPQAHNMAATENELPLFKELTAPNGTKWTQPLGKLLLSTPHCGDEIPNESLGLFINNEFVKSKSGSTLSSISPM